jgi:hypothetical protein
MENETSKRVESWTSVVPYLRRIDLREALDDIKNAFYYFLVRQVFVSVRRHGSDPVHEGGENRTRAVDGQGLRLDGDTEVAKDR